MKSSELRQKFLDFFESKDHKVYPSASLIPTDDPTLLFTGSGMNQFKEQFLGHIKDSRRVVTAQKCLRTVDLERVGRSPGHHTFFEMLGNFSFGDYFKQEAIEWAWEFLTDVLGIPSQRLWVSVYEDDQEAFSIWKDKIKIPAGRIIKLGEKDNFWPSEAPSKGPDGPCGPCTEIFFDQGVDTGCQRPGCNPACECQRFIEVWNLVFTQFDRTSSGRLQPLPNKNIDTGMGLERLTAVVQGVKSNFQTDLFEPIVGHLSKLANCSYGQDGQTDRRIMAIADHIRAVIFLISDGVSPSNQGRGYVERMLIRRAIGHSHALNIGKGPFLYKIVPIVVRIMKDCYPELLEHKDNISKVILSEEKRFQNIIEEAARIQEELMSALSRQGKDIISGEECFRLYDTYGLPLELVEANAERKGFKLDKKGFEEAMLRQRHLSRQGSQIKKTIFAETLAIKIKSKVKATKFVGYEKDSLKTRIVLILNDGKLVEVASQGDDVQVVLEQTPFYGEAGGQIGDSGVIEKGRDAQMEVTDTTVVDEISVHRGKVIKGQLAVGDKVIASVDRQRRENIKKNHTTTHLLQAALRQVLGAQVSQSGSLVSDKRFRFDFTHSGPVGTKDLDRIEEIVNQNIRKNVPVKIENMSLAQAKKEGVMAIFGEKYGEIVRAVIIDDCSKELCGGTHVGATGEIGLFRITSESAVAAGIRRIEALTGTEAYKQIKKDLGVVSGLSRLLNSPPSLITGRVEGLLSELKSYQKEIESLKGKIFRVEIEDLIKGSVQVKQVKIIVSYAEGVGAKELRARTDLIKERLKSAVIVLGAETAGKTLLVIALTGDLIKQGLDARRIVEEIAPLIGGRGGGRPDFAQIGSKDLAGLKRTLKQIPGIVKKYI